MPLTETEWGLVTSWVRDHLLDNPDPRRGLLRTALSRIFVADLPLTPDRDENARRIVGAARKDIAHQRRLLAALSRLDALDRLDAKDAAGRGTEVRSLLGRLREDEEVAHSERDPFSTVVLRDGTAVFIDRSELREKLRRFVADPEQTVLVVDGEPNSGRSYTYQLIRHLGQHCGFRPVRVTLSRTTTAARLVERLDEFVSEPGVDGVPLNPTQLNDPLPSIDDAVHRIVSRATAAEERYWLVLDECDTLDPNSDVWDCIGKLALAIYEHTPVRNRTVPRLVLLGYSTAMRQLPYDIRKNEVRDTARVADADDLRAFFEQFFRESAAPPDEELLPGLVETAVAEVLRAAEAADPADSHMRRICTAVEESVRTYRALTPGHDVTGPLRRALRTPAAPAVPALSEQRRRYREAAALLDDFDPALLRLPGEERATGRAVAELVDDCTALAAPVHALRWVLTPEVREATLKGFAGPAAAKAALDATDLDALPEGPRVERAAAALLSGAPPAAVEPGVEELSDLLQAVLWLRSVPGTEGLLPDAEDVQRRLERARLLQPMRILVQGTFHGRIRELDALRSYLALPAEPAEPPVLIHGIGGIGKSTLLAKFLLDSLREYAPEGFPFAYIDFERPTLSIQEPATMIAEAARQLGIQYPAHRTAFDALADRCGETTAAQRGERNQLDELYQLSATRATLGRDYSAGFHARASAHEQELARELAELVARAVATPAGEMDPPLLIALDSFEQAQYRGSPVLSRMWAVWTALRAAYPRLRYVVAGRALIGHPAVVMDPRTMALGELDEQAAVELLMSSGVDEEDVARSLYDRVGGHPLSLKLAARTAVVLGEESESLGELLTTLPSRRRYFHHKVDQMLIQGTLYDRILKHISDDAVRSLVQAGLALRVITPDLVREVLAEPAGLTVASGIEAGRLFGKLVSRLDLMESAGPQAIRHRSDLRTIMLRLSDRARADLMRAVDTRAVAYYAAREGPAARAEEIYHRLRLGENPRTVELRWERGVESYLVDADNDMSARSAAFLLGRIGGHVPDQIMAEADQEDWERIAAREVEDLLTQGYVEAAAERLAERQPWTPCSRLHALLVETLARSDRAGEARDSADRAVDRAEEAGCAETRLELLQLSARLAQDAGDFVDADRSLQEAESLATSLGLPYESMGVLVARSRLAVVADEGSEETDRRLARTLRGIPDESLAQQPALARAAAASAGRVDPHVLEHTLRLVGLPGDEEAVITALTTWIDTAMADEPQLREPLTRILESAAAGAGMDDRPDASVRTDVTTGATPATAPGASAVHAMPHVQVEAALREALRHGTLDSLARRALALRDRSGDLLLGVAAAMDAGTPVPPPGHAHGFGPGADGQTAVGLTPPPDSAQAAWRKVPYLSDAELLRVQSAAVEAGLADTELRPRLFAGTTRHFRAGLPLRTTPFEQIRSDLLTVNRVERLIDGTVPLEVWLRNALTLTTQQGSVAVFQRALDDVARDAAGEPELPVDFLPGEVKEEVVFRDDTVPFEFLQGGFTAGAAVARISVPPYESGAPLQPAYPHAGTGWLIAPGLLVTNHHVVNARTRTPGTPRALVSDDDLQLQVRNSRSRFDYGSDETETEEATAGALVAWDETLDYAIMRLTSEQPERPVLRVSAVPLAPTASEQVAVNIIQHPGGRPKRVALRNNLVYQADERDVVYFTDTRGGSSGSPVLDDAWTVVALHRGTKRIEEVDFQGRATAFVNVGTQMSRVLAHLRENRPEVYEEIMAAQAALFEQP
ncbi:trypsin-like peptidase domain-containing protein [Streptomyces sp. NPDC094032]|uniref:trypsin-like peptidase domain-containing protein n=1 Tax=Streptomyces sp. NPDC094032 TaxID=3155308 RepID=UPI00331E765D